MEDAKRLTDIKHGCYAQDQPAHRGWEEYQDCEAHQAWSSWLRGEPKTIIDSCFSPVFLSGVVLHTWSKNDFRATDIRVGQMQTHEGIVCVAGTSRGLRFKSGKSYHGPIHPYRLL